MENHVVSKVSEAMNVPYVGTLNGVGKEAFDGMQCSAKSVWRLPYRNVVVFHPRFNP